MYDLSSPDFWVVAVTGLVIGLFFGWLIMSLLQRRANGGKTVAHVRKEMEDYREEVNTHFARTAELFKDTTEKYRDLYEHLAGGAQELCDDLPDRARVEFRPGHLLAASVSQPVDLDEAAASASGDNDNGAGKPEESAPEAALSEPGEPGADAPQETAPDAVLREPGESGAEPARPAAP